MTDLTRIAGIFLVDRRGWVLLQERDEHAPIAPDQWGIVGGHVDEGEEWDEARDRELLEETGLTLADGTLELWYDGVVEHQALGLHHEWRLWTGLVDLTDDDIVCGEGRRIVFVEPSAAHALDLSESLAYFLPELLQSEAFERITRNLASE